MSSNETVFEMGNSHENDQWKMTQNLTEDALFCDGIRKHVDSWTKCIAKLRDYLVK
jgi:hypothetical protein